MTTSPENLTQLLRAAAAGDREREAALAAAIYEDLRRLAASQLRGERQDHTLQPTALAHEAYLRLIDQRTTDWRDRVHFFSVASLLIRRILVDHARERQAAKRGGGRARVQLDDHEIPAPIAEVDLIGLDEALTELALLDPRQAKVVELRFFGGLTNEEVADLLDVGRRTVDRDWQCARGWLFDRLGGGSDDPRIGPRNG